MTELITEQKFQNLLNLSHNMLVSAQQDAWNEVTKLERERLQLMDDLFSSPINIDSHDLEQGIQTILDINRSLVEMSSKYQGTLQQELAKAGHAHKATTAYLNASS